MARLIELNTQITDLEAQISNDIACASAMEFRAAEIRANTDALQATCDALKAERDALPVDGDAV